MEYSQETINRAERIRKQFNIQHWYTPDCVSAESAKIALSLIRMEILVCGGGIGDINEQIDYLTKTYPSVVDFLKKQAEIARETEGLLD